MAASVSVKYGQRVWVLQATCKEASVHEKGVTATELSTAAEPKLNEHTYEQFESQ